MLKDPLPFAAPALVEVGQLLLKPWRCLLLAGCWELDRQLEAGMLDRH